MPQNSYRKENESETHPSLVQLTLWYIRHLMKNIRFGNIWTTYMNHSKLPFNLKRDKRILKCISTSLDSTVFKFIRVLCASLLITLQDKTTALHIREHLDFESQVVNTFTINYNYIFCSHNLLTTRKAMYVQRNIQARSPIIVVVEKQ